MWLQLGLIRENSSPTSNVSDNGTVSAAKQNSKSFFSRRAIFSAMLNIILMRNLVDRECNADKCGRVSARLVRDLRADKHDAIGGGISRKVDA